MTQFLELAVDGVLMEDAEVLSFRGRERLSALYRFDLQLRTESGNPLADLRGRRAHFTFRGERGARSLHGMLTRVSDAPPDARDGFLHTLRLVPQLWLAKKRVRSRIFQDLRVIDIVAEVAREWHPNVEVGCRGNYPRRGYCVQYRESDYSFFRRLLAEYGLNFWFAPREDEDALVIGDHPSHFPALSHPLAYRRRSTGIASEDSITDFRLQTSVDSGDFSMTEFDWKRPERGEFATASARPSSGGYDETRLRIDDHLGRRAREREHAREVAVRLRRPRELGGEVWRRERIGLRDHGRARRDIDQLDLGWWFRRRCGRRDRRPLDSQRRRDRSNQRRRRQRRDRGRRTYTSGA